ncbi:protein-disulfide reductase DsbD domain-containing protein [Dinghuibacter silviterrae]|uniref:Disulfide bond corrector protein DsbC n=1 Tax=Dinghuibacter silviterrae TaxID=1539049 RepID=A0A4R8DR84_9BACT|nr:protein-disulfide reductase DsbD domain-containing protein [Dinghuibacter silviterrae]TDX00479.1 disulfide bond corrector protein DsbC [Dinghuibacter silviterrae]
MRIFLLNALALLAFHTGDTPQPVHWTYQVDKVGNDVFRLIIHAALDEGWHIYAQRQPKKTTVKPTATSFHFLNSPLLTYEGPVKEEGKLFHYRDEETGIAQDQYSGNVVFTQVVRLRGHATVQLTGTVDYQVCTEKECLPPTTSSFSVSLSETGHDERASPDLKPKS